MRTVFKEYSLFTLLLAFTSSHYRIPAHIQMLFLQPSDISFLCVQPPDKENLAVTKLSQGYNFGGKKILVNQMCFSTNLALQEDQLGALCQPLGWRADGQFIFKVSCVYRVSSRRPECLKGSDCHSFMGSISVLARLFAKLLFSHSPRGIPL